MAKKAKKAKKRRSKPKGKWSSFLSLLNKNDGALNFFLMVITATIALTALIHAYMPIEIIPDIQIHTNMPEDTLNLHNPIVLANFDVSFYNAGNAPCFDAKVSTYNAIQGVTVISPSDKTVVPVVLSSMKETNFFLGTVTPDEIVKLKFNFIKLDEEDKEYIVNKRNPMQLTIECRDRKFTKKIYFKNVKNMDYQ